MILAATKGQTLRGHGDRGWAGECLAAAQHNSGMEPAYESVQLCQALQLHLECDVRKVNKSLLRLVKQHIMRHCLW
jgi:hypothetical protein